MDCVYCKGNISVCITDYTVILKDCVILIKDIPSQKCDLCGETFFSFNVATKLDVIVNHEKVNSNRMTEVVYS
ncbi:MAG: hypothetical protein BEN18_04135 [Epulopiscium sp. Nuni2H_MBin001]|nr:MAG: hypothetical protein BEN18_04135 [Epulopiscium sp. Nuni2H_MBin001]